MLTQNSHSRVTHTERNPCLKYRVYILLSNFDLPHVGYFPRYWSTNCSSIWFRFVLQIMLSNDLEVDNRQYLLMLFLNISCANSRLYQYWMLSFSSKLKSTFFRSGSTKTIAADSLTSCVQEHQKPQYWVCRINGSYFSNRKSTACDVSVLRNGAKC